MQALIHRWSSGNSVDRLERSTEFRKAVAVAVSDSILERLRDLRNHFIPTGSVRDTHGGGWSRKINARYLHTLMVYL